jgi:hypothetical protein
VVRKWCNVGPSVPLPWNAILCRQCRHAEASHFWLNEGWTTYIERVLQGILHSQAERGMFLLYADVVKSERPV